MMAWLPGVLVWLVLCVVPSLLWLRFVWRAPPKRAPAPIVWGTAALAVATGVGAALVHSFAVELTGLRQQPSTFGAPAGLAFAFVLSGPVAEGAKVAACWPAFRSSHFDEAFDGFLYATASATGFAIGQSAVVSMSAPPSVDGVLRMVLMVCAHPVMSPIWGYFLGRVWRSRTPSGRFIGSWCAVTVVHGLFLHLIRATSLVVLMAAFPVLFGLALLTWWIAQDLLAQVGRRARISVGAVLLSLPPPSLSAVRRALRRAEKPIPMHWIAFGALTTSGVMLAMVAMAVWTGHQIGLDFSTIEREDASAGAIAPLVLLTTSILAAFPVSGYLVTKASNSDGVLEPALSAALAIGGFLVVVGLADPVALVFALACSPVAFALACAGAWFGLGK